MAGVSAARRLRERGVEDIMVVEATDRIGGRVKEVQFGGVTVELGANWVHYSELEEEDVILESKIHEALNNVEHACGYYADLEFHS